MLRRNRIPVYSVWIRDSTSICWHLICFTKFWLLHKSSFFCAISWWASSVEEELNICSIFKYHVSVRYWFIFITYFFTVVPFYVVFFFPVSLSSFMRHCQQVLKGVKVSSVSWLGQLTVGVQITDYFNCQFSNFLLLLGKRCFFFRKINTLEEIEILKAASSKYLLNDVIAGQNTQCTNFSSHQWFELQDNSPDQATKTISKSNN